MPKKVRISLSQNENSNATIFIHHLVEHLLMKQLDIPPELQSKALYNAMVAKTRRKS